MKIICIGRNYTEHIRELNSAMPEAPVFFLKPDTALLTRNRPFLYPNFSKEIHHEVELVLKISRTCKTASPESAHECYDKIGLGFDFTARDLQEQAKKKGLPWALSKGFDQSAPTGRFFPKSAFPDVRNISFHLDVNGKTVQTGNSSMMIYPFDEIIEYISRFMTLRPGDLIFTGTPAGVGPVHPGDLLEGYLEDRKVLTTEIR